MEMAGAISLNSDATWKVSPLERYQGGNPWFDPGYDDITWNNAVLMPGSTANLKVVTDPNLFRAGLNGDWLTGQTANSAQFLFRKTVDLSSIPRQAWVRITTPQHYAIFVNGSFIGERTPANFVDMYDITPFLDTGDNVIAVYIRPPEPSALPSLPLRFFLDGAIYARDSKQPITLRSDCSWKVSSFATRGWINKSWDDSKWNNAVALRAFTTYDAETLGRSYLPYTSVGARYYWELVPCLLTGVAGALILWLLAARWGTGSIWSMRAALSPASGCFIPSLGLMLAAYLLDFRLAASYWKVLFYSRELWIGILIASSCLTITLLFQVRSMLANPPKPVPGEMSSGTGQTSVWQRRRTLVLVAVAVITLLGAFLRLWALGFQGFHSDEFASMEAAMGIVRTGAPEYLTGIWYSRSPLYHYLVALFIAIFGNSPAIGRLPAALFGIALIPFGYKFCKDILGRPGIGLLFASLIAFNPWIIFVSRNVRYYQQGQFLVLLSLYFFIKGFIKDNQPRYQILAFVTFMATCLTIEVGVLLLPSFCLCYLFVGPRYSVRQRWSHFFGLAALLSIVLLDVGVFTIMCLTPFVGIGETCRSIISLHYSDLPYFSTAFFAGDGRLNVIFAAFFFLGVPFWMARKNRMMVFLSSYVLIALVVTSLFVMQIATRYSYHIYPLLMLLAVIAAVDIFKTMADLVLRTTDMRPAMLAQTGCAFVITAMFLSYQPGRIARSFNTRISRSDLLAYKYVRQHLRPTIWSCAPSPRARPLPSGALLTISSRLASALTKSTRTMARSLTAGGEGA